MGQGESAALVVLGVPVVLGELAALVEWVNPAALEGLAVRGARVVPEVRAGQGVPVELVAQAARVARADLGILAAQVAQAVVFVPAVPHRGSGQASCRPMPLDREAATLGAVAIAPRKSRRVVLAVRPTMRLAATEGEAPHKASVTVAKPAASLP